MAKRADQLTVMTTARICLGAFALCAAAWAPAASAQIVRSVDSSGRALFINADPPARIKLKGARTPRAIYLPAQSTFMGRSRPEMSIDRDGVEKLVREAATRHN
ncbi:MAG: hypothetical protein WB543_06590, partial [Candidatus Acidiferrum sp.]